MRRSGWSRALRFRQVACVASVAALFGFAGCGGGGKSHPPAGKAGTSGMAGKSGGSGRGGAGGRAGGDQGGEAGEQASGGNRGGGTSTGGRDAAGGAGGRASGGRGGSAGTPATGGGGSAGSAGEGGEAGEAGAGTGGAGPAGACVKVAPDGDDVAAVASSGATPFGSVQAAVDFAAANPSLATAVCVAAGPGCGESASYPGPSAAPLVMRDGVSVYGRYESTSFTRCADSTTTLLPATAAGVHFGPDITRETVLDGLTVVLAPGGTPAGISVDGAAGVVLNDLTITDEPSAPSDAPIGVLVTGGADVVVTGTKIRLMLERNVQNGLGVGLQVQASRVRVSRSEVVGRVDFGQAAGIYLADSPGSVIASTSITVAPGNEGEHSGFGVWVDGDLDGVLLDRLTVDVEAGDSSTGVAFVGPGSATLRNSTVAVASGGVAVEGVYADAEVAIRRNDILADFASTSLVDRGTTTAIDCPGICNIRQNDVRVEHTATTIGDAGTSVGIACSDCDEIALNEVRILGALGGLRTAYYEAFGIDAGDGDVLVDRNLVGIGCADEAIGVWATGARVQNNVITGRVCNAVDDLPVFSNGLVAGGDSDVHSNTILSGTCTGDDAAVFLNDGGAILRNNILGGCGFNVDEPNGNRDPLFIQNNAFEAPSYRNGATILSTVVEINALPGAAANFASDCSGPAPTPCDGAGTPVGAPAYDIDGEPRGNPPDVGADEG